MKVRFEIEVENTAILDGPVPANNEIFRGVENKNFLSQDPLTGNFFIQTCIRGIDDEHKYADVWQFTLPVNAKIIDGAESEVDPIAELRLLMEQSHESLVKELKESVEVVLNTVDQQHTVVQTDGISENTLLEALRIVSKKEE